MHGLGAGSVLILDDIDEEARPIREALAQRGIGAIHVSDEMQPESPLRGIRVALLDIHLQGLASGPDASVDATRDLIDQIIHEENGPYVAVIWTGRPDEVDRFERELGKIRCPPVRTVTLEKSRVIGDGGSGVQGILNAIDKAITDIPALPIASLWEEIVREAANDTLVSLDLADEQAVDRLAALLRAEADQGALDEDAAGMRSLLAALNPVHFDRAEERSAGMGGASAVAPIRERAKAMKNALPLAQQAQLNGALLFDPRADGFGPGRLYRYGDIESLGIGAALAGEDRIRRDTAEDEYLDDSPDDALPVFFLEVSAACDHQQGKLRAARLIAGVAFPAAKFGTGDRGRQGRRGPHKVRDGAHLRTLQAVRVPGFPDEGARIVWNAHYPVAVSLGDALTLDGIKKIKPIGRFREPLLADIRAWLGYHAGRPGYVSIG